jgi:hypothetical protein
LGRLSKLKNDKKKRAVGDGRMMVGTIPPWLSVIFSGWGNEEEEIVD